MARERIQTRDDRDVKEAVEQMADEKDITEAEAVRRLIRTGLTVEGYDAPGTVGTEAVEQLAEREGYVEAGVNRYVRIAGGLLILLALLVLLVAAVL
jgi:hypothetical protein